MSHGRLAAAIALVLLLAMSPSALAEDGPEDESSSGQSVGEVDESCRLWHIGSGGPRISVDPILGIIYLHPECITSLIGPA